VQAVEPEDVVDGTSDGGASGASSAGKKGSPHNPVLGEVKDFDEIPGMPSLVSPEEDFKYLSGNDTDFKEVHRFHVKDDLEPSECDIVHEGVHKTIPGKIVVIIIEVKSGRDKFALFQLARYVIEYLTKKHKENCNQPLPRTIAVVFYHGKGRWNLKALQALMRKSCNEESCSIICLAALFLSLRGIPEEKVRKSVKYMPIFLATA
jgi:hypothetical protein